MEEERIPVEVGINKHVYYGTCTTAAAISTKQVVIQNPTLYIETEGGVDKYYLDLSEGDQLIVSFSEKNTANEPTIVLRVQDQQDDIGTYIDSGRITVDGLGGPFLINYWEAGDIITFTYVVNTNANVGYWVINNYGPASENKYGTVKLTDTNSPEYAGSTEHNNTASIPKIQEMIKDNISLLSLAWGQNWGDLTLKYGDSTLSQDDLPTVSFPTDTASFINDGPPNSGPESYYIYKQSGNINESQTSLTIGAINSGAINTGGAAISSGAINTNGQRIDSGVIYSSYINTGGNNLSTENLTTHDKGSITGGAINASGTITCKAINTQNSNIDAGTGTITCGGITSTGNITASGKTISAATISGTTISGTTIGNKSTSTVNAAAINIGNQTLAQYIDARIHSRVTFQTKYFECGIYVNANSQMTAAYSPGVRDSDYMVHIPIAQTGWTPLGVVGTLLGKYGDRTLAKLPVFQDCYLSGSNVNFHVQTAGNTAGYVLVGFYVLYYK